MGALQLALSGAWVNLSDEIWPRRNSMMEEFGFRNAQTRSSVDLTVAGLVITKAQRLASIADARR